jgi:hypothetical protein
MQGGYALALIKEDRSLQWRHIFGPVGASITLWRSAGLPSAQVAVEVKIFFRG